MYKFRKAKIIDSVSLTKLAIQSEAYWDYDDIFIEKFAELYNVSEEYIASNPVYILYNENDMIGFYGMLLSEEETALEYLYVAPEFIGNGYGKILWNHMINICLEKGIKEFHLVTSPQAKDFYIKLGARYIGEVESLVIKNRMIPKLQYNIL